MAGISFVAPVSQSCRVVHSSLYAVKAAHTELNFPFLRSSIAELILFSHSEVIFANWLIKCVNFWSEKILCSGWILWVVDSRVPILHQLVFVKISRWIFFSLYWWHSYLHNWFSTETLRACTNGAQKVTIGGVTSGYWQVQIQDKIVSLPEVHNWSWERNTNEPRKSTSNCWMASSPFSKSCTSLYWICQLLLMVHKNVLGIDSSFCWTHKEEHSIQINRLYKWNVKKVKVDVHISTHSLAVQFELWDSCQSEFIRMCGWRTAYAVQFEWNSPSMCFLFKEEWPSWMQL